MSTLRDDFRQWLESKSPHAIVGRRWGLSGPLAVFLTKKTGQHWSADTSTYWFENCPELPLPVWAQEFEKALDESAATQFETSTIQARTALKILKR